MHYLKLIQTLVFCALFFVAGSVNAASTVISEGFATITSSVNSKEYRKRAIENALQNIALEREQALTSFTIIENGQMLLDQVRSTSKTGVVSYKILQEAKRNTTYYVKIEAVVRDADQYRDSRDNAVICRKTNLPAIDLDLALRIDRQQFPPWMDLNIAWLKDKITKAGLDPKLSFIVKNQKSTKSSDLYTLFDKNNTDVRNQNLYQLKLKLNFSAARNESFFIKNNILNLALTSTVFRDGISVQEGNENFEFTISKKFGTGIPIQNNKKIWQSEKDKIALMIIDTIQQIIDQLRCISTKATLKKKNKKYFIEHGIIEGIKSTDIFILETAETQKFYFKVIDLSEQETYLELISEVGNINFKDSHTVRIVEGL
jgi:hypothetical protein